MPDIRFVIYDAYGFGGTVRATIETANALAAVGLDVELVSVFASRRRPALPIDPKVRLTCLGIGRRRARGDAAWRNHGSRLKTLLNKIPSLCAPRVNPSSSNFSLLSDLKLLRWYRKQKGGYVVGTRLELNVLLCRMSNPRVHLCLQEHTYFGAHEEETQQLISRLYPRADTVITITRDDAGNYQRQLDGGARVITIPNSVPNLEYQQSTREDERRLLCTARLSPEKGVDLLIEAMALVVRHRPEIAVDVLGAGSLEKDLRDQIYRLGLYNNVFLRGDVTDVTRYYGNASVYLQPSRFEGFGIAILEAMASGLPVIAFDCPVGPRQIIRDETDGVLVPPGDVGEFARQIIRFVDDATLRERMGNAALEASSRFSIDRTLRGWYRLLNWSTDAVPHTREATAVAEIDH